MLIDLIRKFPLLLLMTSCGSAATGSLANVAATETSADSVQTSDQALDETDLPDDEEPTSQAEQTTFSWRRCDSLASDTDFPRPDHHHEDLVHVRLARSQHRAEHYAEALASWDTAIEHTFGAVPSYRCEASISALRAGDFVRAEELARLGLRAVDPGGAQSTVSSCLYNLGRALEAQNRMAEALSAYTDAARYATRTATAAEAATRIIQTHPGLTATPINLNQLEPAGGGALRLEFLTEPYEVGRPDYGRYLILRWALGDASALIAHEYEGEGEYIFLDVSLFRSFGPYTVLLVGYRRCERHGQEPRECSMESRLHVFEVAGVALRSWRSLITQSRSSAEAITRSCRTEQHETHCSPGQVVYRTDLGSCADFSLSRDGIEVTGHQLDGGDGAIIESLFEAISIVPEDEIGRSVEEEPEVQSARRHLSRRRTRTLEITPEAAVRLPWDLTSPPFVMHNPAEDAVYPVTIE